MGTCTGGISFKVVQLDTFQMIMEEILTIQIYKKMFLLCIKYCYYGSFSNVLLMVELWGGGGGGGEFYH